MGATAPGLDVIVVPDAGPLIYLAGAGRLEVLPVLYAEVVVPRIVFDEIVVAGAGLTGAREVAAATWLRGLAHHRSHGVAGDVRVGALA